MARPGWNGSTVDDVAATEGSTALVQNKVYFVTFTKDAWFKVDDTSGGSITAATSGAHYCAAGDGRRIATSDTGKSLYYIRDSEDGKVCLSDVTE